jgi:hypothetical protein
MKIFDASINTTLSLEGNLVVFGVGDNQISDDCQTKARFGTSTLISVILIAGIFPSSLIVEFWSPT